MNVSFTDILSGTPIWVFVLLGYLVWRSASSLRPRVVPMARVLIVPGIFVASGLIGLFGRHLGFSEIVSRWCLGAILGGGLGLLSRPRLKFDRETKLVWMPGSALPLLRVFVIFGSHYLLNVQAALHPGLRDVYMAWDVAVSGASAGYFVCWALRFRQSCSDSASTTLNSSVVPGGS